MSTVDWASDPVGWARKLQEDFLHPRVPKPRAVLGYNEHRDTTVVAFKNRLGGQSWLRDENGQLAPVATGRVGTERRAALEARYSHIDMVFRSLE